MSLEWWPYSTPTASYEYDAQGNVVAVVRVVQSDADKQLRDYEHRQQQQQR